MDENAAEVIKHLADKIDAPVQQLWAGLVAYAPFTYYQWLASAALCAAILVAFVGLLAFGLWAAKKDDDYIPLAAIGFFGAIVTLVISGNIVVGDAANALSAKYAPEAWAAKQVIKTLKQ